ncbi:hypothetical protein LRY70_10600 [Ectothiorhodospira mobilis]|nr:hypothetical protein [Ectothiorhodospira mobilis]
MVQSGAASSTYSTCATDFTPTEYVSSLTVNASGVVNAKGDLSGDGTDDVSVTLTPAITSTGDQITSWTCTGDPSKWMPANCRS